MYTRLDRDLGLAGRVIVNDQEGSFTSKLVKVDRPIIRIPTLAIHREFNVRKHYLINTYLSEVDRDVNSNFKFNQETEMVPVLGLMASQLNEQSQTNQSDSDTVKAASSIQDDHHPALLSLLAEELSVKPQEIRDFELQALLLNF